MSAFRPLHGTPALAAEASPIKSCYQAEARCALNGCRSPWLGGKDAPHGVFLRVVTKVVAAQGLHDVVLDLGFAKTRLLYFTHFAPPKGEELGVWPTEYFYQRVWTKSAQLHPVFQCVVSTATRKAGRAAAISCPSGMQYHGLRGRVQ